MSKTSPSIRILGKNPNSEYRPIGRDRDRDRNRAKSPAPSALPLQGSWTHTWPKWIRVIRWNYRSLLAEFFGTFLLMALGLGVCLQVTLFGLGGGAPINVHFGWGLAVALAVYTTGGVSAHLNPAVTFTFALYRGFPWEWVVPFWVSQILGSFTASALVYLDFRERLEFYEMEIDLPRGLDGDIHTATASMFATFPGEGVSLWGAFFDELFTTALLMAFIFALDDQRNVAPKSNMGPFMVGMVVFALCMSFSSVSGLAMNPARDLGPRIFIGMAGWGRGAFTVDAYYWWVPVVAPLLGGPIGAGLYEFFVCVDVEEEIELNLTAAMVHERESEIGQNSCQTLSNLEWMPIPEIRNEIPNIVGLSRRQSKAHTHHFGKLRTLRGSQSNLFLQDPKQIEEVIQCAGSNKSSAARLSAFGGTDIKLGQRRYHTVHY
ncbi:hypothetical protein AAMO2058_001526700 [Amorphochlora amoebiformis]